MKSIHEVQHIVMELTSVKLLQSMNLDEVMYKQHAEILQAIVNRDPQQIGQTMEAHLGRILNICGENSL